MLDKLLNRPVPSRPPTLRFSGRVLFLVDDAELMRQQLFEGHDLELADELRARLRHDISTDEITPAYICYFYDQTLGDFPYLGLRTTNRATGRPEFPVTRGSVKAAGFVCSVAGRRRGKGSSREQSPYAELMAGIRVVIGESIERIYNENCQNLGILTSTNFELLDRIRSSEEIALEEFASDADPITRQIIEYGGLFEFNVARLQGRVSIPLPDCLLEEERALAPEEDAESPAAAGTRPPGPGRREAAAAVAKATNLPDQEELRVRRGSGEAVAGFAAYQLVATSQPANPPVLTPAGHPGDMRGHGPSGAPAVLRARASPSRQPMTLAEKILASHWVVDATRGKVGVPWVRAAEAGFVRTDIRFSHEYVTPMAAIFFEQKLGPEGRVVDPDTILFFRDHLTFLEKAMTKERVEQGLLEVAAQLEIKQREFAEKQRIRLYGEQGGHVLGSEAICHSKILEAYAEPGMLVIGSDSHTPHAGAVGCVAFGVGTTAIFNSWITQDVRVTVPRTFRVVVKGRPRGNVTAKDYMLEILRQPYVRDGHAIGQIVEYAGPAVEALSVDERATMTNMAAEVGAFTGIVSADERTVEFLVSGRGMDRARAEQLVHGMQSDPEAEYVTIIEIDASAIRPMVALPGDPGNGIYIEELGSEPIRLDIAYAGSCTAGKKEDMEMYAAVFREAYGRWGLKVHPHVRCFIQCGSIDVREYCRRQGYLDLFEKVGAIFIEPGCGACIAAGPGASYTPDEVTISSQNRNFPGRSGPGQLYLASPYTVAASAIAGCITAWEPGVPLRQLDPAARR
ncbi:MAG: hypothetical protein HY704_07010 [Gemmatimonadetes bacterium]|nr:hypothetical protein [Gemmatimonadota bacterium]